MTILSDFQITALCQYSKMVHPFDENLVNPASIDLRLGNTILWESPDQEEMIEHSIVSYSQKNPFILNPGDFILAQTIEEFKLPRNIAAKFLLKSSVGRRGLQHIHSGFCDPGWHGSVLTMQIYNAKKFHVINLWPGMRIGQMIFEKMDSGPLNSYAEVGHYNNDKLPTQAKQI